MKTLPSNSVSAPETGRLERWLHAIYFRGAGIQHFLGRRLRPAGVGLGLVFVLASCLGIGHNKAPVYQLFSLSLGMIVIGIPWAMSRRANVEAKRELPRFGTAGEPLRYTVKVSNRGRRKLTRAWISDTSPDPRPSIEDFTLLREPGEEERNAYDRRFAYFRWQWLMMGNRLFSGGISTDDLDLKQGQEARVSVEMTPLRRGVIRFDDLRLLLPDPFGLFQRCRKVSAPACTLTVLPRRFPLPPIELPGGAAFKISGEANTNAIGNSGEFVGLRDYRPGDPLRQIHWKSWARTGRPIVKELEDTFYPRYGLIVDTLSCDRTDHQFEEAISVAASFAASLDTSESLLDLMFIKNEAHMVTAGRGIERAEKLLEVLAGVSPERTENFTALAQLVLRHRDDLTSCLVIFNGWDDVRAAFLHTLTRGGVVCAPVIIGKGPAPGDVPGHWLESGQIARDLQKLPNKLIALN
ncbi:MAG: DUF58 domain-containing protein [Luteolibacter sp.]|uniref:DUF58 domain-containing protein n=1 Tax=Luteolibacter sp. TaxID=1962973 RepID=UPI003264DB3A